MRASLQGTKLDPDGQLLPTLEAGAPRVVADPPTPPWDRGEGPCAVAWPREPCLGTSRFSIPLNV